MSSSAKALLERAAMCCEATALSEGQERAIKLVALHVIDLCGSAITDRCEQTKLLLSVLDAEK